MKRKTLPILLLLCCHILFAQTYTFNGNGNWSNAANWLNSSKPPTPILPNSTININPENNGQCVVDVPVTIPATATLNVFPNAQLVVMGNLTIQPSNNYPTRLKKELMLFSNSSGGYDTSAALIYYYDNANRLIITIDCNFGDNTNDTTDNRYFRYYYHGTDTLPYTRTLTYYPGSYYTDTAFYTYYPDGRMDYDSSLHYSNPPMTVSSSATARKFYYNSDSIRLESRKYSNGAFTGLNTGYTYQSKRNGNLVYQKDSVPGSITEITISHLPNANPFYAAMRCGRRGIIESEYKRWEWQDAPKNLISRWYQVYNGSSVIEDEKLIGYTLRNDGYPMEADVTSINIYNGGAPNSEVFKVAYVYE